MAQETHFQRPSLDAIKAAMHRVIDLAAAGEGPIQPPTAFLLMHLWVEVLAERVKVTMPADAAPPHGSHAPA